jgi:hypothetical protein
MVEYPRRGKREVEIAAYLSSNVRAPDWYDSYKDESTYKIYVKAKSA